MSSASNSNVPVYGNYHSYAFFFSKVQTSNLIQLSYSYYSKRPFASDSRLSALPKGFFHGTTVLDIGCNEGWVTCEIGDHLHPFAPACELTLLVRK